MTLIRTTTHPCSSTEHLDGGPTPTVGDEHAPPAALPVDPLGVWSAESEGHRGDERRCQAAAWRVAAWMAPNDLSHLAAALGPTAQVVACDSLAALVAAVGDGAAAAAMGSASLANPDFVVLADLITDYPSTVFAGIGVPPWGSDGTMARFWVISHARRLRGAGVRALCQSANEGDWNVVARSLASARLVDPVQRAGVAAVLGDVWGGDRMGWRGVDENGLLQFFAAAFGPEIHTVGDVAAQLEVDVAALSAWFVDRRLPGPDRYVAAARLVRAAWTGEPPAPGAITAAVWHPQLEAGANIHRAARRLRRLAALGAGASPRWLDGTDTLNSFRVALVVPFRHALRTFDPARLAAS